MSEEALQSPAHKRDNDLLLKLPAGAGRAIAESGGVAAAPLMRAEKFAQFATDRGLRVDAARLNRFERLGIFRPIFRVSTPSEDVPQLSLPPTKTNNWFDRGWAIDTSGREPYEVPPISNDAEAYYSRFQLDHLSIALSQMNLNVHLDSYVGRPASDPVDFLSKGGVWLEHAEHSVEHLRDHEFRPAIALLCQYVSDRYYGRARTDGRTYGSGKSTYWDTWISVHPRQDDGEREPWDPIQAEVLFQLTPKNLRHAFEALSSAQDFCDPLSNWYQLVQFIKVEERERLKGKALQAVSLREAAAMLALLHRELYQEELPHPNELHRQIIHPMPELEVRDDVRRHLEFVANRYGVNPQPKLTLFVEGQTEELVVRELLPELFGHHPGVAGIEIVNLQGVDNATGGRKDDRFRAILRLVDYLHHHQTLTFIVLDNENAAAKLKREARTFRSLHHSARFATRPDHIRVWRTSFEFDNFSATELAAALSTVSGSRHKFTVAEVRSCKAAKAPGSALSDLYKTRCNYALQKPELAKALLQIALSPTSRRSLEQRPIVQVLTKVETLAARNPLPTRQELWSHNQTSRYFGRRPSR